MKYREPYIEKAGPIELVLVWTTWSITIMLIWYGVYRLTLWAILLPTVYESYESGYCVYVDDPRGVYTCDNLPRKHYHRWTQ